MIQDEGYLLASRIIGASIAIGRIICITNQPNGTITAVDPRRLARNSNSVVGIDGEVDVITVLEQTHHAIDVSSFGVLNGHIEFLFPPFR